MSGRACKLIRRWTSMRRQPYRQAKRQYSRLSWQGRTKLLAAIRQFIEERK